ncbi:hypothetical protein FEM48_Zijuj01G0084600 [Ziziphus jujuba var. spinosa]|uniref:Calcium-transporting ATPase 12, plasma membrane-type-like n=2 Tax=Ziziphus jujuba TaxID=326968 RepID=A0A978W069_ZIZJJ|nr:hypothetical protein FEM48_Zijuj01G0084600 [Ziziphus jujuba var. spinosa]
MQQNQMNQMSDSSSSLQQHVDLESQQQKVLLRARWRRFLLIIKVHRAFMSIPVDKLNKFAPRVSVSSSSSSSSATAAAVLSTQHYTALSSMVTNEDADEYSYSALPHDQVSIEVHPDAEEQDDYCRRARDNANLQRENIVKIVKDKDMDSLQSFGGVQGMAEALCTDLELGICGDEERLDIRYAGESALLSTTQAIEAPRKGLLGLLRQYSCNNCNILLLSLCAVLSIGFGIKEEGWKTGWNEGAIILVAIFILVAAPSIRDFFRKRSQKLLEMQKPIETGMLTVIRGGCEKEVSISNVMVGDLVYLKSGCPIPGDGLFIVNSGDDQVLVVDHDGLESTADEKTPFLFYGAKVINGNGRMLITSRGMDTVLRELMNKVSNTRSLTPLPAQLDKVGATTQIAGISISILILVVLFLRFMLESKQTNKNKHSAGLPDLRNTTATKGIIDIIEKIVKKPSGKISPFTASLTILLVGIQEPIPFLIILATVYWRKKMFSCKVAYAQELLASVTVGSASIICAEKLYQPEIAMFYVGEENIQKDCWVAGIDICVREDLCQCISNPILMQSVPGGLALLSEPPTDELMQKPPISQTVPFITKSMWRNIVTQALYQTSILVTFHFKGKNLLGISKQVSFTEISHIIMDYGRLDKTQWGLCLLMGFISLPIDSSVKLTTSFFKIHPLLPNIIGSTSFTPSVPAESTVSTILELPLMVAGENCESTT